MSESPDAVTRHNRAAKRCRTCGQALRQHEKACDYPQSIFCVICMMPITKELAGWDVNDTPLRTIPLLHPSCRRGCGADNGDIFDLWNIRDTSWPLTPRQTYLRARSITVEVVLQMWRKDTPSTSDLMQQLQRLPLELMEIIAEYTFPSVLTRSVIIAWTKQSLDSSSGCVRDLVGYKSLVSLLNNRNSLEHLDLLLEITEESLARWRLCSGAHVLVRKPGRWYTRVSASRLPDLVRGLKDGSRTWSDLRDVLSNCEPSTFMWDTPNPPNFNPLNSLSPVLAARPSETLVEVLDNTKPLRGITTVHTYGNTLAVVLHQEEQCSKETIRYLDRQWPDALFQYWNLQSDFIESVWVNYECSMFLSSLTLVMRTLNGQWIRAGPDIAQDRSQWEFTRIAAEQPQYIAIGFTLKRTLTSIATIPSAAAPKERDKSEPRPEYDERMFGSSKKVPADRRDAWDPPHFIYSHVDASLFETCILAIDSHWDCIRGVMFLDNNNNSSATLGQWRHGIDDADSAERLSLADGVRLKSHRDNIGQRVIRAGGSEGIPLRGALSWWCGNGFDHIAAEDDSDSARV